MRKALLAAVAALVTSGVASADSITTLFARNNGGSNGGAVYFDITVHNFPITVTGYDTNTADLVQFDWTVYIILNNTSAGNETNGGLWTQVATGTGQGMGNDIPSPVTLNNTFNLPVGTHAMALVMGAQAGHDYTNGNGSNENYTNGDVSLALGSATNVPFSGTPFRPRIWNGTIYYDAVPAPGAVALLGLAGLATRRRRRA